MHYAMCDCPKLLCIRSVCLIEIAKSQNFSVGYSFSFIFSKTEIQFYN